MRDIQRQRLQTPLLGCHRVIRMAETGGGVLFAPCTSGMVCHVERGAEGGVVGNLGWAVAEIVGSNGSRRGKGDRRVLGREKETSGEGAEASQMVDGKRDEGYVVGVEGVDDSLRG